MVVISIIQGFCTACDYKYCAATKVMYFFCYSKRICYFFVIAQIKTGLFGYIVYFVFRFTLLLVNTIHKRIREDVMWSIIATKGIRLMLLSPLFPLLDVAKDATPSRGSCLTYQKHTFIFFYFFQILFLKFFYKSPLFCKRGRLLLARRSQRPLPSG